MDLTALDTFLELKQGIGTHGNPHPDHVAQLDGYLKQSEHAGRVRMGILTEGQFGARDVQTRIPHLAQTSDAVNRQLSCFSSRYMNLLAVFQI